LGEQEVPVESNDAVDPPLVRAGISLDRDNRQVICRGHSAPLTKREFQVLRVLMEAEGRVLDASAIQAAAFGPEVRARSQQVPTIVARLRRRLGDPRLIETIVGEGYRIVSSAELSRLAVDPLS
jgi:two-component system response regulator VanR